MRVAVQIRRPGLPLDDDVVQVAGMPAEPLNSSGIDGAVRNEKDRGADWKAQTVHPGQRHQHMLVLQRLPFRQAVEAPALVAAKERAGFFFRRKNKSYHRTRHALSGKERRV